MEAGTVADSLFQLIIAANDGFGMKGYIKVQFGNQQAVDEGTVKTYKRQEIQPYARLTEDLSRRY